MIQKTIREISDAWREDKRPYVKLSTLAAYMLILENHILPKFGESNELHENDVQGFVLEKLEGGLSVKSVKDILNCPEDGYEIRSEKRMDELLRMGY